MLSPLPKGRTYEEILQHPYFFVTFLNSSNVSDSAERINIMENENRNTWTWGFTAGAENWNGRLAMIGFVSAIVIELLSGQGVLHFWGII